MSYDTDTDGGTGTSRGPTDDTAGRGQQKR